MSNELQTFTNGLFGSVRAVIIEEKVWFVGKDVVEDLGYDLNGKHVASEYINKFVDEDYILNVNKETAPQIKGEFDYKVLGQRGGVLINEYGVIELTLSSKLKQAKQFKKWIIEEVIPSVLQTGSYSVTKQPDSYMIEDPIERARRWADEMEEKQKLQLELQEAQPKVEAYDEFMNADGTYSTRNACKMLGLPERKTFEWLREKKLVCKDCAKPTAKGVEMEIFKLVMKGKFDTMVVTPKGIEYLRDKCKHLVKN